MKLVTAVRWYLLATVAATSPALARAELPSVEGVLRTHQENLARLNPLHLQAAHTREWTDAYRQARQVQAKQIRQILDQIKSGEITLDSFGPQIAASGMTLDQMTASLQDQLQAQDALSGARNSRELLEIFIDGENYQVRLPAPHLQGESLTDWAFPEGPVTANSLVSNFANVRIVSRSTSLDPPIRVWGGMAPSGGPQDALIIKGDYSDAQGTMLPPFATALKPRWDHRHPYDEFFRASAENYRVVRHEAINGRELTVVDALVPHGVSYARLNDDGATETYPRADFYRAWLDLARGALPMKLEHWYGGEGVDLDHPPKSHPAMRTTTTELRELPGGSFYPATTVREDFQLTSTGAEETTGAPSEYEVHERLTWQCTLVENPAPLDESFFVLDFPPGQPMFDMEANKPVGGLERSPPVKAGEPAPPLALARWLDGKSRTLDDLRGQVVVLDFWGLWCGACKNTLPSLKEVQEHYRDQPVVFIAIHTAENNADALATRIDKFAELQGWHFLHAIDAGTMAANSATSHAYGVIGYPTEVVIAPDGRIVFNSSEPPPGMEDIFGKSREETTPEQLKQMEQFMRDQFAAAGVEWPGDDAPMEEQVDAMNRLHVFMLKREIEKALDARSAAEAK